MKVSLCILLSLAALGWSAPPPAELRVVGRELQTPDGKAVWLQGINVPSLEWSTPGERVLQSVAVAIDDWKANIIRLPVEDTRWFGRAGDQKDGGEKYRALVDQAIEAAETRGAYLLLDLHRYRAPSDATVEFWRAAAERYKNRASVLFGLLNEPHGISWETWRDGGIVEEKVKPKPGVVAENTQQTTTFTSPGMQRLVAAVRETGARNVVTVGGLDWAYDLSGVLNGFALSDPGGNGIVYESHVYPWKSKWRERFLAVAEKHPVLLGEVGCDIKPMPFLSKMPDPYTWAPDMIGCIQKNRLHWTAWTFHPAATPRMLQSWDYTPTPFWGAFVRDALHGKQFEMIRER